jgi:hypothetical protein
MSMLYTPLLVVHVVIAVLGVGSLASVAVLAASGRTQLLTSIPPLLRYSAISLGAMLITGILLDIAARGALHQAWWFRGSAVLLIATGALHGMARRTIRHSGDGSLRRLARIAYGMCGLVAAITILMEVKPF